MYDLYKAWLKRVNPSSTAVGKTTFTNELLKLIEEDPSCEWYTKGKGANVRAGTRMAAPEPMIMQYDLTQWRNPCYRGNDLDQICTPVQNGMYRGLLRKTPNIAIQGEDNPTAS